MARDRVRLTARGLAVSVVAALCVVGGVLAYYPGLTGTGAAATTLVVVALASVWSPGPVRAEIVLPRARVPRLTRATAVVRLHNTSWLGTQVRGALVVAGQEHPFDGGWLAPHGDAEVEVEFDTTRRGRHEIGPLRVVRTGLAGLADARTSVTRSVTLLVTPRTLTMTGPVAGHRRGQVGASARVERGGVDLVGLHEYQPGDDLRRLSWTASARTGTLMVREDADPDAPHLTVVLDDRAASHRRDSMEEAVDLVASLVTACAERAVPGRLLTFGGLDRELPVTPGGVGLPRLDDDLLDTLTTVDASAADDAAPRLGPAELLDVLVLVTGPDADPTALLARGGRAGSVTLLVVDPAPDRLLGALQDAQVLRGPRAEDLVVAWQRGAP